MGRAKEGRGGDGRGEIISIFERQVNGDGRDCKHPCETVPFVAPKRKGQSWSSGKRKDNLESHTVGLTGSLEFVARSHRE